MEEAPDALPTEQAPNDTAAPRTLAIAFTGSGSEYFRIWIVNLLLTLVTLGIYYPWAKVRRLRYFYGNTLVDGDPLGFHGEPKKMLKGYALVALLFACYSGAGRFSPTAGVVALLLIAALWPALFKASMQFALANTSWRGLRFRFTGSVAQAYRSVLPLALPVALLVGLSHSDALRTADRGLGNELLFLYLVALPLLPWLLWRVKSFQHAHYALGSEQTTFGASIWSFYKLALKVLSWYLLIVVALMAVMFLAIFKGAVGGPQGGLDQGPVVAGLFIGLLAVFYLGIFAVNAYAQSRAQNLVWNHTRSPHAQFHSALRFGPLGRLTVKNVFFVLITLGLYWPFAAVAIRRMRLEAVTVALHMAPEDLLGSGLAPAGDATGDAAGDFFGIDLGL